MGAGLAARALMEPVDEDAKCVLFAMALMALDAPRKTQPAATYFGGQDYLMQVALNHVPDHGTVAYESAARKIRRRIQKLQDAGSIKLIQPAAGRRPARYELILTGIEPVDNPR